MTRTKQNTASRDKIISAATHLFLNSHDAGKVSIEDIARKARVSPTTIYNNFGGRKALVQGVVKKIIDNNIAQAKNIMASSLPFPDKIQLILSNKNDMAGKMPEEILKKLVHMDDDVAALIQEIYQKEIQPMWQKLIADGKAEGYVDPSISEETAFIYLKIMRDGFNANAALFEPSKDKINLMMGLSRIMMYGFFKNDACPIPTRQNIQAKTG
ncbi:TetR/AcrR family transcriptional regulator [Dehalococcoides mccartyi]|uniref:TetR/AcrR family transcriptional regulator n=1 Tax=Dehalococcoides mccartyi TaxID=61435 RepID=UPI00059DC828|nr:TetR/AcrR family transcriptional regulator [Dehalococcoides mccartyi]OBW60757.1 MAG: TetR family transcriptional regulator [Dehalococcoides mccartyi]